MELTLKMHSTKLQQDFMCFLIFNNIKLVSVATDGAPAMVSKRIALIGVMKCDLNFPELFLIHFIIDRKHLAAKHFRYEDVIKTLLQK